MNLRLLPYTPERDVYRLLGLPSNASSDEITTACRRLARTFHPDRNLSTRATQEMQVVNTVRRVMTDPETRALYDRERWRYLAEVSRPLPLTPEWSPRSAQSPAAASAARYMRAALVGVRTAIIGLTPPRCRRCRTVIGGEDLYCAACGTRLLSGVDPEARSGLDEGPRGGAQAERARREGG